MVERRIVLFIHNLLSFRPGVAAIEAKVVKGKDAKSSYLPSVLDDEHEDDQVGEQEEGIRNKAVVAEERADEGKGGYSKEGVGKKKD